MDAKTKARIKQIREIFPAKIEQFKSFEQQLGTVAQETERLKRAIGEAKAGNQPVFELRAKLRELEAEADDLQLGMAALTPEIAEADEAFRWARQAEEADKALEIYPKLEAAKIQVVKAFQQLLEALIALRGLEQQYRRHNTQAGEQALRVETNVAVPHEYIWEQVKPAISRLRMANIFSLSGKDQLKSARLDLETPQYENRYLHAGERD